jgi:hypothetical protein
MTATAESPQRARARQPDRLLLSAAAKGYGFPGAGSNDAHNLPLGANPRTDVRARELFEAGARALWVSREEAAAARRS